MNRWRENARTLNQRDNQTSVASGRQSEAAQPGEGPEEEPISIFAPAIEGPTTAGQESSFQSVDQDAPVVELKVMVSNLYDEIKN